MAHILLVLRHSNSLDLMNDSLESNDVSITGVVLDPIESADDVQSGLDQIKNAINAVDGIALGTKVYDTDKEISRFAEFLQFLKDAGLQDHQPVCITHLAKFEPSELEALKKIHPSIHVVENDNIGRHGPATFSQLILQAVKK
jgi:hypothetical protein